MFASYWHRHTKIHCEEHSEHPEMVGEMVKIFVVVRTEWASTCRLVRETRWVAKHLTVYLCSSAKRELSFSTIRVFIRVSDICCDLSDITDTDRK